MISKKLLRSLIFIGAFYLLNQVPLYATNKNNPQVKSTHKEHHHHHHSSQKSSAPESENLRMQPSQSSVQNPETLKRESEPPSMQISQGPTQLSVDFSNSKAGELLNRDECLERDDWQPEKQLPPNDNQYTKNFEKILTYFKYSYNQYIESWGNNFFSHIATAGIVVFATCILMSERSKAAARRIIKGVGNFRGWLSGRYFSKKQKSCDCGGDEAPKTLRDAPGVLKFMADEQKRVKELDNGKDQPKNPSSSEPESQGVGSIKPSDNSDNSSPAGSEGGISGLNEQLN